MAASEPAFTQKPNVTVQAQTTNNTTVTTAGASNLGQPVAQPVTQKRNIGNSRPTAKGNLKGSVVKARKKR
jgi:hypothetical protein